MKLRALAQTGSPVVLLTPTARGEVLVGCADGEVLLLQDQTLSPAFPATGSPARAAARCGDALVTLDRARLVRRRVRGRTRRWVFPLELARDVLWAPAHVRPTVVAAAVHPVDPVIAVVSDVHAFSNGYAIGLLDWEARRLLPWPGLPDLSEFVALDHHYSQRIDHLAFAPDGETLVMTGLATLYNSDGDWEFGSPRRVLATRWRLGQGLGAVVPDVADRPSEHVPMPIAFSKDEVLAGNFRVPWRQLQAGYTEDAELWSCRRVLHNAADPSGTQVVGIVRGEGGDQLEIADLAQEDDLRLLHIDGQATAIALDTRRGRVLIGFGDGRLMEGVFGQD